jgi:hypothetical protein
VAKSYIAPEHERIFKQAARTYEVWILVRESNPKAWRFYDRDGYYPKRLDIKAKTAKKDLPPYELAGLVPNPETHPGAFGDRNLGKVHEYWKATLPHVYIPAPGENRVYLPAGKLYSVESDPRHKHYGCLYFTLYGLASKKLFICGDYDLYGLISAKDPSQHLFVEETMLGQPHARTPELRDVQYFLNRELGAPLIQHGAQESFMSHQEEGVVIFWPDGNQVTYANNKKEIEELYRGLFQGRPAHQAGTPADSAHGRWNKGRR